MQGVFEGYGETFATVKWNTPDYNKLAHIEQQCYQFATAKNYHEVRELTSALKDGDKFRTFTEFKNKAITIVEEYDGRHLKTEYQAAIVGAQMASKWVDFQQHPDALLEYRTAGDARVRDEHRALRGIRRPVTDAFWKRFYPPNGWNCRCTVIRLNDGEPSTDQDTNRAAASVAPMKGFDTNLAETGYIFPASSPYFIGVPDSIKQKVFSILPYERRFETIYTSNVKNKLGQSGQVTRHIDVVTDPEKAKDYDMVLTIAKEKADLGEQVQMLPILNRASDTERRKVLMPDVIGRKNPDLRIGTELVEVKAQITTGKLRAFKENLETGASQANHVILNIPEAYDVPSFEDVIDKKFDKHPNLKMVEIRHEGKYEYYPRNGREKKSKEQRAEWHKKKNGA